MCLSPFKYSEEQIKNIVKGNKSLREENEHLRTWLYLVEKELENMHKSNSNKKN